MIFSIPELCTHFLGALEVNCVINGFIGKQPTTKLSILVLGVFIYEVFSLINWKKFCNLNANFPTTTGKIMSNKLIYYASSALTRRNYWFVVLNEIEIRERAEKSIEWRIDGAVSDSFCDTLTKSLLRNCQISIRSVENRSFIKCFYLNSVWTL